MAKKKQQNPSGPNRAARRSGNPAVRNEVQDKPQPPAQEPQMPTPDLDSENIRKDEDGTWFVETINGTEIVLPVFSELRGGLLRRMRHLDQTDGIWTLLENLCDEDELEALDQLSLNELADFFRRWQQSSGVSLGE